MKRKFLVDDNYFELIDTQEKAYWLGFISADGCLVGKNILKIRLHKKDDGHIRKFLSGIQSNNTIYYDKNSVEIQISSEKLCLDLNRLGITKRKSLTIVPYNTLQNLESHYWRGVFDGDGSIYKGDPWKIVLYGTKEMCQGFLDFSVLNGVDTKTIVKPNRGIYQVHIGGIQYTYKLGKILYKDASIVLDRKYFLFQELIKDYDRWQENKRNK